jgi:hypothetical protein
MSDHTITNSIRLILSSIDKYVDHEYKIGDFIYGLLYEGHSKEEIIMHVKQIPEEVSLIAQKTLDYIDDRIDDDWYNNEL